MGLLVVSEALRCSEGTVLQSERPRVGDIVLILSLPRTSSLELKLAGRSLEHDRF